MSLALQTSGQIDHWTMPSHWPYNDIRTDRPLDHAISLALKRHQDKQITGPRHLTGPTKTSGQIDHWTTPSHWPYKDIRTNRSLDHAISLALQRHQDKQITGPRHLTGPTKTSGQIDHWTTPSHWPYRHQDKQITGPRHVTGPTDIRTNRSLDHAISLALQ